MGCYYTTAEMPDQKGEGMIFSGYEEVDLAFAQGIIALHAKIKMRLPRHQRLKTEVGNGVYGEMIETTPGRVRFNEMLPTGMDFYNNAMRSGDLARCISDCYQRLGRKATINLLDDMMQLGFRESTRSGLSFATDDLVTPDSKTEFIKTAEKAVMKLKKSYDRGLMTSQERYNHVLDEWTNARELITTDMMDAMKTDIREGGWYINPVYLDVALGCSWWYRTNSAIGRHAWSDGQADRGNYRDADQGQLPRRPVGVGVLQFDPRCTERLGRYRTEDR